MDNITSRAPSQVSGKPEDVCVGMTVSVPRRGGSRSMPRNRGTPESRAHQQASACSSRADPHGTLRSRLLEYNARRAFLTPSHCQSILNQRINKEKDMYICIIHLTHQ